MLHKAKGPSLIFATTEERSDFVVISEKGDENFRSAVLKDKSECAIPTAFEQLVTEFSYPQAGMDMWRTETSRQFT